MNTVFDLSFRLTGSYIPYDHGYSLYSSLSTLHPTLHNAEWLAIHPIHGLQVRSRTLKLTERSRLRFRVPADFLSLLLPLAGRRLVLIDGESTFTLNVGVPELQQLRPKPDLFSRCVTIKLSAAEKDDRPPNREMFLAAIRGQMRQLNIEGELLIDDKQDSKGHDVSRRVIHIKQQTIVGYSVRVSGLSEEHSLKLQEVGIGGRRRMGCGIFNPIASSRSKEQPA